MTQRAKVELGVRLKNQQGEEVGLAVLYLLRAPLLELRHVQQALRSDVAEQGSLHPEDKKYNCTTIQEPF